MWARWTEVVLGVWLIVSSVVFAHPIGRESLAVPFLAGVAVIAIANAARARSITRALGLVVALGLIAWGWARFPRPGPPVAQNAILVGLMIGLTAVVPSDSSEPPPGWRPHVRGSD